jgi:hypothetical protein
VKYSIVTLLLLALPCLRACDSCRSSAGDPESGGGVSQTASTGGEHPYRWSVDTSFEYRNWDRINPSVAFAINNTENGHTHSIQDEWFVTTRVGYVVTPDVAVGLSQNYRHLRQVNVNDALTLGHHEVAEGFGDLEFDVKWRFKKQTEKFPVDLTLFGSLKPPTGQTRERTPSGELFDTEDQPGSGSWDGAFGVSASHRRGPWGASGSIGYAVKGEGSQHFKAGDVLRISLGAAYRLPVEPLGWKLFASAGAQGLIEFKGKTNGEIDRNHGGQTIYALSGFSAKPIDRLIIGVNAQLPVYQELNGFHQKQDFGVQFSVGVKF